MNATSEKDATKGTVREVVLGVLGHRLTTLSQRRFEDHGWFYAGPATASCSEHGDAFHVLRKRYLSAGKEYFYVACICIGCSSAVSARDLGVTTGSLGLQNPRPATKPKTSKPDSGEGNSVKSAQSEKHPLADLDFTEGIDDLEFGDLIADCIDSLPDERERCILRARLGVQGRPQSLAAIAESHGLSGPWVGQLQKRAVLWSANQARSNPKSAAYKLAAAIGTIGQPNHLATAERIYARVGHGSVRAARIRSMLWTQMAGAMPTCAEHVTNMVLGQIQASEDWRKKSAKEFRYKVHASKRLHSLLTETEWPTTPTTNPMIHPISPVRAVASGTSAGQKYFAKAGRVVAYESAGEHDILSILNRAPEVRTFIEQPCRVSYTEGNRLRHYVPDLLVVLEDGRLLLVEVKDPLHLVDAVNLKKYDAGRAYAHSRGWGWAVYNNAISLAALRSRNIPDRTIELFEERLRDGPITTSILRSLKDDTQFEWADLLAATLQKGWAMSHRPFRLSIADDHHLVHAVTANGSRRP